MLRRNDIFAHSAMEITREIVGKNPIAGNSQMKIELGDGDDKSGEAQAEEHVSDVTPYHETWR